MQMSLLHFSKIRSVSKVQKALNEGSMRDEENRESFFHRCHSGQEEDHKDSSGLVLLAQMMVWQDAGHPCTSWERQGKPFSTEHSPRPTFSTLCAPLPCTQVCKKLSIRSEQRDLVHTQVCIYMHTCNCAPRHTQRLLKIWLFWGASWSLGCPGSRFALEMTDRVHCCKMVVVPSGL